MENDKLEAIASVVMESNMQAQEDLRRRRETEADRLRIQRRYAAFGFSGFFIGAVVGYLVFGSVPTLGLVGGFVGVLVGRLSGMGSK